MIESVTKLQAAKRQLRIAIRLWCEDADSVAVHSLTAAAHQILHDLLRKNEAGTHLRSAAIVAPENRKLVMQAIAKYENFFKHADRDPEDTLEFNPEYTDMMLLDACDACWRISGKDFVEAKALRTWLLLKHPDLLLPEARVRQGKLLSQYGPENRSFSKQDFLTAFER